MRIGAFTPIPRQIAERASDLRERALIAIAKQREQPVRVAALECVREAVEQRVRPIRTLGDYCSWLEFNLIPTGKRVQNAEAVILAVQPVVV